MDKDNIRPTILSQKNIILTLCLIILLLPGAFSQNLEVEGKIRVTEMDTADNEQLLVVKKADGTLAARTLKSLPPDPPDTMRSLETDLALAKLLCACNNNLPPFLLQSSLESGYSILDLYNAGVPLSNFINAGVEIDSILNNGLTVPGLLNDGTSPLELWSYGIHPDSLYGEYLQGGMIFYLDTLDLYPFEGLVSAGSNQDTVSWGCWLTDLPNVPNVSCCPLQSGSGAEIGDGQTNTDSILVNGCIGAADAPKICGDLVLNGYDDWFLPSMKELIEMYNTIGPGAAPPNTNIGNFTLSFYWSSSEQNHARALGLVFSNNQQLWMNKNESARIRPVRAF